MKREWEEEDEEEQRRGEQGEGGTRAGDEGRGRTERRMAADHGGGKVRIGEWCRWVGGGRGCGAGVVLGGVVGVRAATPGRCWVSPAASSTVGAAVALPAGGGGVGAASAWWGVGEGKTVGGVDALQRSSCSSSSSHAECSGSPQPSPLQQRPHAERTD